MRITVENHQIECFENELDYKNWMKDYTTPPIYHGKLYNIPLDIKQMFSNNFIVSIKRLNYNEVQYILIYK